MTDKIVNAEYLSVELEKAMNLTQLITEDVEGNFFGASVSRDVMARASITVSALYILSDHLKNIEKAVQV